MHERPPAPPPRASGPRAILAYGSLGLTALGLGLVAYDVVTAELRGTGLWAVLAGALGLVASALWGGADDASCVEPDLVERGARAVPRGEGAAPLPRRAAALTIGVAVVLVVQALVPLRYYLGDDAYDERFSWRMFSAVRMHRCALTAYETRGGVEQPVSLHTQVQAGWVTTLERNREAVVERYLRWRCEAEGLSAARLENRCTSPEGRSVPPVLRAIDCASGALRREGGHP